MYAQIVKHTRVNTIDRETDDDDNDDDNNNALDDDNVDVFTHFIIYF